MGNYYMYARYVATRLSLSLGYGFDKKLGPVLGD